MLFAICAACDQPAVKEQPARAQEPLGVLQERSAWKLLRVDFQERLSNGSKVAFRDADMRIQAESSRAISGLTYYWGIYRPTGVPHGFGFSLAAGLGDRTALIRQSADWGSLTRQWVPLSKESASQACIEFVQATSPNRHPVQRPVVFQPDTGVRPTLELQNPKLLRKQATEPARVESRLPGWEAEFWFVELRRAARYRCAWSTEHGPQLIVVDSIPGAGFQDFVL